ncbi:MAG: 3-isopropylmalate dehydratase large subunit [Ruminiclostridium sp.]|jgi:3-isopropylmalate/(R)-2-methylmalate dehydratase large subunit|nr:3-isopropylmalate dehydratase large subunit [Ruminiclostridium sp.]
MGMTMTQKILAAHAGLPEVKPGQLIRAKLDIVLGNDITSPVAIREFEKEGFTGVFDKSRIAMVMDHFTPNKDIKAAEQCLQCRTFAKRFDLDHFYDVGQMGVEHALLPEKGLVGAGDCIIGADSHTCTYGALGAFSTGVGSTDMAAGMATGETWFKVPEAIRVHLTGKLQPLVSGKDVILHLIGKIGVDGALYQSLEYCGEGVASLSMDDRLCIANMSIEAGAKNGIFPVDEKTKAFLDGRAQRPYTVYEADPDAEYARTIDIDLSSIEPTVAFPHLPENAKPISQVEEIPIDQVIIGSCTNGRLEDMEIAAKLLQGKKVAPHVRCIVMPATQEIFKTCAQQGYLTTFIDAGCAVSTPTCGPCLGGHMGVMANGERCVATTNRNFVGRMGGITSEIYLASPAVAAASAIAGKIADPRAL